MNPGPIPGHSVGTQWIKQVTTEARRAGLPGVLGNAGEESWDRTKDKERTVKGRSGGSKQPGGTHLQERALISWIGCLPTLMMMTRAHFINPQNVPGPWEHLHVSFHCISLSCGERTLTTHISQMAPLRLREVK